jgi:VWFA-related protein
MTSSSPGMSHLAGGTRIVHPLLHFGITISVMPLRARILSSALVLASVLTASAQEQVQTSIWAAQSTIAVHSDLVLVPAFVKTQHGELVFSLKADDFALTDDGISQKLFLEPDTDSQPLALAVVVQTGGLGASHLEDYRGLEAGLEAVIGAVPYLISVVSFDSHAHLEQEFDPGSDKAAEVIAGLKPGDKGAAIVDGLIFATAQLAKQPARYKRALILFSETIDSGSQASLDEALRAIDDTNTAVYSFAFSIKKTVLKHEGAKLPNPISRTKYSATPYKAGGCMSRDPDANPDAHGNRTVQASDCVNDLLPPLRIARLAYIAAMDSMQKNVPETVATLTGGEYFGFKNSKSLRQSLSSISNDIHNHYVLSFQPSLPHPGLHSLSLSLKDRPELVIKARGAYWFNTNQ